MGEGRTLDAIWVLKGSGGRAHRCKHVYLHFDQRKHRSEGRGSCRAFFAAVNTAPLARGRTRAARLGSAGASPSRFAFSIHGKDVYWGGQSAFPGRAWERGCSIGEKCRIVYYFLVIP